MSVSGYGRGKMIEALERLFVLVFLGALLLWLIKDIRRKLTDGKFDPNKMLWLDYLWLDLLSPNIKRLPIVDRNKLPFDFWFTIIFRSVMASIVALFFLIYSYFSLAT
jgi:hypothetical protein